MHKSVLCVKRSMYSTIIDFWNDCNLYFAYSATPLQNVHKKAATKGNLKHL